MLPALNSLERLRDLALLGFRVVAGGTMLFYGASELAAGEAAWRELGGSFGLVGGRTMAGWLGAVVAAVVATGGAAVVCGVWTRWAALALAVCGAGAAVARWSEVRGGTLASAAAFFYPLTLAAAFVLLATLGGGRYGVDGVVRERRKRRRRQGA